MSSSSSTHSSSKSSSDDEEYNTSNDIENEIVQKVDDCIFNLQNQLRHQHKLIQELSSYAQPRRRVKKRNYINRDRQGGHNRLYADYFSDNPTYTDAQFRRRFRMRRPVFLRIVEALGNHTPYFTQRFEASGRRGLSPLQKCTAALRMLAYGMSADSCDEYVRLGETTTRECIVKFAEGVINVFGGEYLRRPNQSDLQRLLYVNEQRGFPGMIGSIDCMHWKWKNCPVGWQGQYARGHGKPTVVLEAIASYDLWIWHAYFGTPGSCNDINVLDRSPVFDDIYNGNAPHVAFTVNGNQYNLGYYLTDGIYPPWATFIQSIRHPQGEKNKLFAQVQESVRKDVERAFGVLQARFAVIRDPARFWEVQTLSNIMNACIILHNMIVEDERDTYLLAADMSQFDQNDIDEPYFCERTVEHGQYIRNIIQVRDRDSHHRLLLDLIEHIWQRFGPGRN